MADNKKEQVEIWFARELQSILGYARWENFVVAINRAVESCKTQGINVDDHFREVTKMIEIGKGGKREVEDYMLTRDFYPAIPHPETGEPTRREFLGLYYLISLKTLLIISAVSIFRIFNK